jgi:hypothetical protein
MNPGAAEEAGKAVGGVVEAMKSQPMCLALLIIVLGLLGFIYYLASSFAEHRSKQLEFLSHCLDRSGGMKLQSERTRPFVPPLVKPIPVEP